MKILRIFCLAILVLVTLGITQQFAQSPPPTKTPIDRYFKGKVVAIEKQEEKKEIGGYTHFVQKLKIQLLEGPEKGETITIDYGGAIRITPAQKIQKNETVIMIKTVNQKNETSYTIFDKFRLNNIVYIFFGFAALVIATAGRKGLGALIGLGVSLAIILQYIVPQILEGKDPVLVTIIGAICILVTTMFIAHGFNKKTTISFIATFLTLIIVGVLSVLFVKLSHLTGLGSEDTYMLQFNPVNINLQGILLGGIILGALGVLDDITTTQTAAVFELAKIDKSISLRTLFGKGLVIGKDHIASLVNTLVLAYAGASLGLFILFVMNPSNQPYWVIVNSEIITEEIIRTLAGSTGLVLAVPITTFLASWVVTRSSRK